MATSSASSTRRGHIHPSNLLPTGTGLESIGASLADCTFGFSSELTLDTAIIHLARLGVPVPALVLLPDSAIANLYIEIVRCANDATRSRDYIVITLSGCARPLGLCDSQRGTSMVVYVKNWQVVDASSKLVRALWRELEYPMTTDLSPKEQYAVAMRLHRKDYLRMHSIDGPVDNPIIMLAFDTALHGLVADIRATSTILPDPYRWKPFDMTEFNDLYERFGLSSEPMTAGGQFKDSVRAMVSRLSTLARRLQETLQETLPSYEDVAAAAAVGSPVVVIPPTFTEVAHSLRPAYVLMSLWGTVHEPQMTVREHRNGLTWRHTGSAPRWFVASYYRALDEGTVVAGKHVAFSVRRRSGPDMDLTERPTADHVSLPFVMTVDWSDVFVSFEPNSSEDRTLLTQ